MINIEYYKQWVSDYLQKAVDLVLRPKVMALFENAIFFVEKVKTKLSVQEEDVLRQLLATREIPSPKLIIKDHKTINKKMEF